MITLSYYNASRKIIPPYGVVQLNDTLAVPLSPGSTPQPSMPSGSTPTIYSDYAINVVQPDGTGPYAIDDGGGAQVGGYGNCLIPVDNACWVAYSPSTAPTTPWISGVGAVSGSFVADDAGSDFIYAGQFDATNGRLLVFKPPGSLLQPYVVTSLTTSFDANGGDFNGANHLAYFYSTWGSQTKQQNTPASDQVFLAKPYKSGAYSGFNQANGNSAYIEDLPGKAIYVSGRFIRGVLMTGQLFFMQPISQYGKDSGDSPITGPNAVKGDVVSGGQAERWNGTITSATSFGGGNFTYTAGFNPVIFMFSRLAVNKFIVNAPVSNPFGLTLQVNQPVIIGWQSNAANLGLPGTSQGWTLLDYGCTNLG